MGISNLIQIYFSNKTVSITEITYYKVTQESMNMAERNLSILRTPRDKQHIIKYQNDKKTQP